jgi:hypothetical protein
MNILTDRRRSRRIDLPCRSALARPSPVCGTPRSETLHATRSHLSDNYHITLRGRTARIPLNCRDLRHFPFASSKTDYHITSESAAHRYRAVPSNEKSISASINFVLRFRSTSFASLQFRNLRSSRPELPVIFDFQVARKTGREQSDSSDLIFRHNKNTIRHNNFSALFARISCPPPTCNPKVHFLAFFKNTITLRHCSRPSRPQSPKRKPATILERFDPRLDFQDGIANSRQTVTPVRRREEFGFNNTGPVGQREEFHRLPCDLMMRALLDDETAGRHGFAA